MNYGKKSTQKREKELTSKSTMIRKKFYVIFCKSLLADCFPNSKIFFHIAENTFEIWYL